MDSSPMVNPLAVKPVANTQPQANVVKPATNTQPQANAVKPLSVKPTVSTQLQDEAVKPATSKLKRILIVEDEEDAASVFKTLIESTGKYTAEIALDGKKALDMQRINRYDLILLDIIMPVMDGIETLKVIKENPSEYGDPIVLMLTNLTGEMAEESVKKYKADGYIIKIDTEPEKLLQKIDLALINK